MFESLPQWMQDLVPWMTWIGLAGVVIAVVWDLIKKMRKARDHSHSAFDD